MTVKEVLKRITPINSIKEIYKGNYKIYKEPFIELIEDLPFEELSKLKGVEIFTENLKITVDSNKNQEYFFKVE